MRIAGTDLARAQPMAHAESVSRIPARRLEPPRPRPRVPQASRIARESSRARQIAARPAPPAVAAKPSVPPPLPKPAPSAEELSASALSPIESSPALDSSPARDLGAPRSTWPVTFARTLAFFVADVALASVAAVLLAIASAWTQAGARWARASERARAR